jgi:hypothetical protein
MITYLAEKLPIGRARYATVQHVTQAYPTLWSNGFSMEPAAAARRKKLCALTGICHFATS